MGRFAHHTNKLFNQFRKRISSASPLLIEDAYVEKVKAGANLQVIKSEIEEIKVSGECFLDHSYIHHLIANQKLTIEDEVTIGTLIAMSQVDAKECYCKVFRNCLARGNNESNSRKVKGCIHALTYENYTSSVLDYDFSYTNILNKYFLECQKPIKCSYFISFAPFYIPEIEADVMFIRPYFNTNVNRLVANQLWIENKLRDKELIDAVPSICDLRELVNKQFEMSKMRVETIEAEHVVIENCDVQLIVAKDCVIKDNCVVERVEVSGTIEIHKNSRVKELIVNGERK